MEKIFLTRRLKRIVYQFDKKARMNKKSQQIDSVGSFLLSRTSSRFPYKVERTTHILFFALSMEYRNFPPLIRLF